MGGRGARNPRRAPNGGGKRLGEARRRGKTRGKGGCDPPRSSCPSPPRCRLARPPAPALLLSRPPPPPPCRRARTRAGPRRGRGAGAEGEDNKDILHIHSCWGGGARAGDPGRAGAGWGGRGGGMEVAASTMPGRRRGRSGPRRPDSRTRPPPGSGPGRGGASHRGGRPRGRPGVRLWRALCRRPSPAAAAPGSERG
ncbi:uncharacterized protein FLJ37310-like [Globicephala melas]|uniref:uncharacterized protein FLJ37310-like n=1 Tax=Globicephala melas TaxID=9731 RepID=UPI0038731770